MHSEHDQETNHGSFEGSVESAIQGPYEGSVESAIQGPNEGSFEDGTDAMHIDTGCVFRSFFVWFDCREYRCKHHCQLQQRLHGRRNGDVRDRRDV